MSEPLVLVRGEVTARRQMLDSRLGQLMAAGTLFTLHIGKKSWSVRPNPEDFGLKEFPKIFKPGSMVLMPDAVLNKINLPEGRARTHLDDKSFHFGESSRSGFRFVHTKKIGEVCLKLDDYRTEFFKAVDNLVERYEDSKVEMQKIYFEHWEELKTANPNLQMIQDNYARRHALWEALSASYPVVADIRKHYKFTFTMRQMSFPASLETINFRDVLRNQEYDEKHLQRLDNMVSAGKQQIEREVTEFVRSTFSGLRGQVVDVFQGLLKKVSEGEPLNKKNVTSVREIMAHVEELDFLDDAAFKAQLRNVAMELGTREDYNDDAAAARALASVLNDTISFVSKTTETSSMDTAEKFFSRSLDLN